MSTTTDFSHLPGRLIVVEGIDGSGKSTQLDLLHKWLRSEGYVTVFTEWNSSPIVRDTTKRGKRKQLLTPMSFSLVHAADFASRTHEQILPALQAGVIVLADRYVYTAFARDAARGVNRNWVRDLYSFAPPPNLALYFHVSLDESIRRIAAARAEIKFYEAGMDLSLSDDLQESFRLFQGRILEEYDTLCEEYDITRIDASQPLVSQQVRVRELVEPLLEGMPRREISNVPAHIQTGFASLAAGGGR
ncbi:MAG: dTMP kinase [Chloroflexi bacterium]|nr:dTMP kinase [Chloroflexota bacterium]MCY3696710.1 dTMP kinase [Chloroflexota bacterium]MYB21490.1 dTMP kinase [Chloroflexota bacterium]MYD16004.1 dTMP kinase [Chloroflexota bacterium]MYF81105.1 dTMP kinase [Chloroflexota bacterium]